MADPPEAEGDAPEEETPVSPPPEFDLEWRAIAFVMEAGSEGVDAEAVKTALLALEPVEHGDGRPIMSYGTVSYDELVSAAGGAEEGSPLNVVHVAISEAKEAHDASEDPDKGEWAVPFNLRAALFDANAENDAATHKAELVALRRAAKDEAREAVKAAEEDVAARRKESIAAAEDAVDAPPPTATSDPVKEADEALGAAEKALKATRKELARKERLMTAPAAMTRAYALAPDWSGSASGGEISEVISGLSDVVGGGLRLRSVINVARARLPPPTPPEPEDSAATTAPPASEDGEETTAEGAEGEDPAEGGPAEEASKPPPAEEEGEPEPPEVDDPYPPLTEALMNAQRDAEIAMEFHAPCRSIAATQADFDRDAPTPDATTLATRVAECLTYTALADALYAKWRARCTLEDVPKVSRRAASADDDQFEDDDVDLRTYRQLLAGVPRERATCATVLDAMIGQVCASSCDPADVALAADVAAAAAAKAAIAEAMATVKLDAIPELGGVGVGGEMLSGATGGGGGAVVWGRTTGRGGASADHVTLLQSGDRATTLKSTFGPGTLASTVFRGDESSAPLASVCVLDPDDVEERASEFSCSIAPGVDRYLMPPKPEMTADEREVRKTRMAACLPSPDTPLATIERHEMLTFAADALPRGYKEDHGKELKRRRHWEPLTREAYAALYHAARLDLKGTQLNYFAPEDALLVTLHAPREEDPVEGYWDGDAPRAFTFAEYHARYFEAATAKKAAEDKAREEAEAAAAIAKAEMEEARRVAEEAGEDFDEENWGKPAKITEESDDDVERAADGVVTDAELSKASDLASELTSEFSAISANHAKNSVEWDLVPDLLPTVAYSTEESTRAPPIGERRQYPRGGAIVSFDASGAPTVVAGGVTLGLRGDALEVTLADETGACVVVRRVADDPPPPPPEPDLDEDGNPIPPPEPEAPEAPEAPELDEDGNPIPAPEPTPPPPPPPRPVQVQYSAASGLCVGVTTERAVLQKMVAPAGATAAGTAPDATVDRATRASRVTETSRAVLPVGAVARYLSDGSVEVLHRDGDVSRRAAGSNEWIGTNNNGTRWAQADPYLFTPSPPEPELDEDGNPVEKEKPPPEEGEEAEEAEPAEPFDPTPYVVVPDPTWVDDIGSSTQIDPDSMAKVTTRSDLVMIVEHETKSTLVYHADGTRAVCAPSEGCAWRIEKEGFAAVQQTRSVGVDGDVVVDLASAIATADVDGVVVLTLADGSVLATEVSGQIAYAPAWLETPEAAARDALRGDVRGVFLFNIERSSMLFGDASGDPTGGFKVKNDGTLGAFIPPQEDPSWMTSYKESIAFKEKSPKSEPKSEPEPESEKEITSPAPKSEPPEEVDEYAGLTPWEKAELKMQKKKKKMEIKRRMVEEEEAMEARTREIVARGGQAGGFLSSTAAHRAARIAAKRMVRESSISIKAPDVAPRLFVVYPDQECFFEVLSERAFAQYARSRSADASCTVTKAKVARTEPGVLSHTYLTPLRLPQMPGDRVEPVPVAPAKPSRPASAGPTIPSLRLPSKPQFPAPPKRMEIPRITAIAPTMPPPPADAAAFVFKQVIEYPDNGATAAALLDRSLLQHAKANIEGAKILPESYELTERSLRDGVITLAMENLADQIVKARVEKEEAYEKRIARERQLAEAKEQAEWEAAQAEAAKVLNRKVARTDRVFEPTPRPMFPPCNFFASEEGTRTLELLKTQPPVVALPKKVKGKFDLPVGVTAARHEPDASPRAPAPRRSATAELAARGGDLRPPAPMVASTAQSRARARQDAALASDGYSGPSHGDPGAVWAASLRDVVSSGAVPDGRDRAWMPSGHATKWEGADVYQSVNAIEVKTNNGSREHARTDFMGRVRPPLAPEQYYKSVARSGYNLRHDEIEGPVKRPLRSAAISLDTNTRGRFAPQFELSPAHVHFGGVTSGNAVARTAELLNVSFDLGRFHLRQPDPSSPFYVEYKPGFVNPGLARKLKIYCHATEPGEHVGEVVITTEKQIFTLTLSAKVLATRADAHAHAAAAYERISRDDRYGDDRYDDDAAMEQDPFEGGSNSLGGGAGGVRTPGVPPSLRSRTRPELDERATLEEMRDRELIASRR